MTLQIIRAAELSEMESHLSQPIKRFLVPIVNENAKNGRGKTVSEDNEPGPVFFQKVGSS